MTKIRITTEMMESASTKMHDMPLGSYFTRLKINNEISDIVISAVSSGVYFYNVTGTIEKDISEKIIGFKYYSEF